MAAAKILTVAVHKGGAGKTTLALHCVHWARKLGLRTLQIDLDAQGNATSNWTDPAAVTNGTAVASHLFDADAGGDGHPITVDDTLELIPADRAGLLVMEQLPDTAARTFGEQVRARSEGYDLVVIDTPPTMGMGMLAPLVAADAAFSPIVPDPYGIQGVTSILDRVEVVRRDWNPRFKFLGLVINRWNSRSKAEGEMVEELRGLGDLMLPTPVHQSAAIASTAFSQRPVWAGARSGHQRKAANEVQALMKAVFSRLGLEGGR